MVTLCVLWRSLWTVLFTSKQDKSCFVFAPSTNIVMQTEQASLNLSQCLTPWLYSTHNPEILQTPVNHPPQVFMISKPTPCTNLLSSAFLHRTPFAPFCLLNDCFEGISCFAEESFVDNETWVVVQVRLDAGGSELVGLVCTQIRL